MGFSYKKIIIFKNYFVSLESFLLFLECKYIEYNFFNRKCFNKLVWFVKKKFYIGMLSNLLMFFFDR